MNNDNVTTAHRIEAGLELMKSNRLEEAKELFTHICNDDPACVEAWHQLSTINGILGNIDAAGECSRRVLQLQPDHCEALVNLGNVYLMQEKFDDAIEQYRLALRINPSHVGALSNLGAALTSTGQYQEAAERYQACIQINPNLINVYFNLGNLRMIEEKYDEAEKNYAQAIRLNPNEALLWNNLGIAQSKLGNTLEAVKSLQEALRLNPDHVNTHNNLGRLFFSLGDADKSIDHYEQVLRLAPGSPNSHINLGSAYLERGKSDQAKSCFQHALDIDPMNVVALSNLGRACRPLEQFDLYFDYYRKAVDLLPDPLTARIDFMEVVENMPVTAYSPWLDEELKKCFSIDGINYNPLEVVAARLLKHKYGIRLPIADDSAHIQSLIEKISADDLFMMVLEKTINIDSELEMAFTKVRRALLNKHWRGDKLTSNELKLISALARQCLNNEYVFAVAEDEQRCLEDIKNSIELLAPSTTSPDSGLECKLFVYGMYERLYTLSCREHLYGMANSGWSEAFSRYLEDALINSVEEERIKRELSHIASIEDQTSQLVQSQYEEDPYPRWLSIPGRPKSDLKQHLRQLFPHFSPPSFLDGPIRVLVAGCGTGQQPIQMALDFDNIEILAVDISKSSLAYAIRMARKYDVKNIRFVHGDILQLSRLDERFHLISCVGVLHHMKDPLKGWNVLTSLLVNNGLMAISLYSEKARKRIVAAREIIKNEQLTPDKNSIRKFRTRILNREFGELLYELHTRPDFHSMSGCRDLLFHFQEHRFTLPQLAQAIDSLHLKFMGFTLIDPIIEKLYHQQFPEDKEMTNLQLWEKYENMYSHTIPGMYNFWCQINR